MNEILGYCLNHPATAMEIESGLLTGDLGSVLQTIRTRVAEHKTPANDKIAVGYYTEEVLRDLTARFSYLTKADFLEVLEQTRTAKKLALFDKTFSEYFRRFTDQQKPNEKLAILTELKQVFQKMDVSISRYLIETNPELMDKWLASYGEPMSYKVKTGITSIDQVIGGLRGTELVIVIADTGIGKSNLLLNLTANMLKANKKVLYFSLEMSTAELLDRFVPIYGNYSARDIRERAVVKEQLGQTITDLKQTDLRVVWSGSITSDDVAYETINQQPDVVMVDYLQRLNDDKGRDTEMERLRSIVRKLKNCALANQIPIITPVQIDKASSKSGQIRVENVAGAKDIANEADLALYLYEKELKRESQQEAIKYETRLRVVKARHSMKGADIIINFDKYNLRMTDMNEGKDWEQINRELPSM